MAKPIPGWLYMIIGLAIIAYTRFIQSRIPTSKIGLFFWVGILFIIFGAIREFLPRLKKRKQGVEHAGPPREHHAVRAASHQHVKPYQHQSHPYTPHHGHPSHPAQAKPKPCPRCHHHTAAHARFCHNCGYQFH